ncbi:hypothetical protein Acor_55090 [Acrocarpospora corrugata]|uniref:DUF6879 domain-containing protein n=1 Tax=Acrocarpospora corrugata TaxID=35763 RepID=A0A5M3W8D1_9ACTN|nr:DUF6879 family protein [Acrocarpospora corrugata]GES03443.1 hypothetical protein Acor_55090 [Acrocarpospora corrugata]
MHLEMHDQHLVTDPRYLAWKEGRPQPETPGGRAFRETVSEAVARGVTIRRARIVSEPVSDYVRWEHSLTADHNIAAGELVRWLPRAFASALPLPGNPFWVFDRRLVRFSLFGGDGQVVGHQFTEDRAVVDLCVAAFEAVWDLAIDHEDYSPPAA